MQVTSNSVQLTCLTWRQWRHKNSFNMLPSGHDKHDTDVTVYTNSTLKSRLSTAYTAHPWGSKHGWPSCSAWSFLPCLISYIHLDKAEFGVGGAGGFHLITTGDLPWFGVAPFGPGLYSCQLSRTEIDDHNKQNCHPKKCFKCCRARLHFNICKCDNTRYF